jgi:hypothetical protein
MTLTPLQERIIQEARTWIGTPWRDGGSAVKGLGVDCGRFAIEVYYACGLCPKYEITVVNPVYCQQRKNPSMILRWLSERADVCRLLPRGLKDVIPGDLICSLEARVVHHVAIIDEDGRHAIGAIARYGVARYLVRGDPRQEKLVKAAFRPLALDAGPITKE